MLKCRCGGELKEQKVDIQPLIERMAGKPPKHRKKRTQKKLRKAYEKKLRLATVVHSMMRAGSHPFFTCTACKGTTGFYEAMGNNMFSVQPLHQGAVQFSKRDNQDD
jgi:hypothetical protein